MTGLERRPWVPLESEERVQQLAHRFAAAEPGELDDTVHALVERNRAIHVDECINLNPAANTMNPRAEALLASGLGSRPSLGYPGDKYEMGLEAVEEIEVLAAELAAEVFSADYAEVRVGSGALANLYVFMATTEPGDPIIAPPATIGGHVTHHRAGAAGLYGLDVHDAPVDRVSYTVDTDALVRAAREHRPSLITIGGSLNLTHHPVTTVREIADEVGAKVLFDAAHLSGLIAGGVWPNPLDDGAHAMTMSTYKSLSGPPAGLLVTNDAAIAERVDAIAFPGLTANFDAANTAALALTLLDWKIHGAAYADAMITTAQVLARELAIQGVPVYASTEVITCSHAFALDVEPGGGHATAKRLRGANLLTSAIGLPHDAAGGVRLGTNEIVRWGMTPSDMPELAQLIADAYRADDADNLAGDVSAFRRRFTDIHFCVDR